MVSNGICRGRRGGSVTLTSPVAVAGPSPQCTGILPRQCCWIQVQSGTTNVSSARKVVNLIAKVLENTVQGTMAAISHLDNDLIYNLPGTAGRVTTA
jgi:hypothetical protein